MSDRMSDERLAVLEKELMRTPLQPYQQKAIELLQAMKAERERIEALGAELYVQSMAGRWKDKRIAELEADRDDQAVKNYEQAKRIAALEKLSVKAAAIHAKTGGEYATGWRDACAWIAQSTRAPEQGDE